MSVLAGLPLTAPFVAGPSQPGCSTSGHSAVQCKAALLRSQWHCTQTHSCRQHALSRSRTACSAAVLSAPVPDQAAPSSSSQDDSNNILTLTSRSDGRHLVTTIHSAAELEQQLSEHESDLTVLMCKARSCRPCKMFSRKFSRMAEGYCTTSFLEIYGDETAETRKMMIEQQIKVTPTFLFFRDHKVVHTLSGINEANLRAAIEER